jgi:hypothetical protein
MGWSGRSVASAVPSSRPPQRRWSGISRSPSEEFHPRPGRRGRASRPRRLETVDWSHGIGDRAARAAPGGGGGAPATQCARLCGAQCRPSSHQACAAARPSRRRIRLNVSSMTKSVVTSRRREREDHERARSLDATLASIAVGTNSRCGFSAGSSCRTIGISCSGRTATVISRSSWHGSRRRTRNVGISLTIPWARAPGSFQGDPRQGRLPFPYRLPLCGAESGSRAAGRLRRGLGLEQCVAPVTSVQLPPAPVAGVASDHVGRIDEPGGDNGRSGAAAGRHQP